MSQTAKVISLHAVREVRTQALQDPEYHARILGMDKLELLEEMVRYQEERSATGVLTTSLMIRGKLLFKALEEHAETQELKLLTKSYRRHLEHEMAEYLKTGRIPSAEASEG